MKPLFLSHFDRMTTILANINLFDADDFCGRDHICNSLIMPLVDVILISYLLLKSDESIYYLHSKNKVLSKCSLSGAHYLSSK